MSETSENKTAKVVKGPFCPRNAFIFISQIFFFFFL
jgi:hypothetical protein